MMAKWSPFASPLPRRLLAGPLVAALVGASSPVPAFALRASGLEENAALEDVAQQLDVPADAIAAHRSGLEGTRSRSFNSVEEGIAHLRDVVQQMRQRHPAVPILLLLDGTVVAPRPRETTHVGKSYLAKAIDPKHQPDETDYGSQFKNLGLTDLAQDITVIHGDVVHRAFEERLAGSTLPKGWTFIEPVELVMRDDEWFRPENPWQSHYSAYLVRLIGKGYSPIQAT